MAIIRGSAQAETLRGTPDADSIFALGGGDRVFARAGNDLADGGAGSDELNGELGNDRLFGDDGFDSLTGGMGNDRVFGGGGDDELRDQANGADGNDVYDGGAGRDLVSFANQALGVRLALAEGSADGRAFQGSEVDVVRAVENVFGSTGADVIAGNSAANALVGFNGNDRIYGRGGNDELGGGGTFGEPAGANFLLDGGAGDDQLTAGLGQARLLGGTGADILNAGQELAARSGDVDRNDLGRDAARDTFEAFVLLDSDDGFLTGFGIERVANFRAQDRLGLTLDESDSGGPVLIAGDYIDSDGNGVVNDADRDARLVGGNLVLDLDQLFEREASFTGDLGEQHVILEDIARINADQFV